MSELRLFSTKPYDRAAFDRVDSSVELTYLEPRLAPDTVGLAESCGATVHHIPPEEFSFGSSRDLLFSLPEGSDFPEGTLATLALNRDVEGKGAWVPAEALGEGVRGLWTLFVVEDGVAHREAVELVHSAEGRAYVRGHLRDGTEIVAAGPHRIADGQHVAPTNG